MAFSPLFPRLALVVSCLAIAPVLAACGGGDSSGSGGSGGSPEPKYEPFPVQAQAWSHGDPSPLEQALLEEIQRARANPGAEVDILLAVPGVKSAMQQFGVDEQKLRDDFATYSPVPPLSFDEKLMQSSLFHSKDMADNGFQDHDGSAGEGFDDRIDATGYNWSFISENIFAYAESVPYCHAAFMVDWGNPTPGHREAILDIDGPKRDIGISIIEDPASNQVGPLVVTQDFAAPLSPPPNAQRFIVGVVYEDLDGDGAYDPDEGKQGLIVVPEKGDYHAVTTRGGGFSIPLASTTGPLKVQVQDDTTFVLDQKDTSLDGQNVKLDFVLSESE